MAGTKMSGKYKLSSSEKFDDYMKAIGVGLATRKMGNLAKPTLTLTITDDSYHYKSESTFRNLEAKWKIGEEFDEETPDGRKVKATLTWEGDKLVQTQRWDGKVTTIERFMEGDDLINICKMGDVVCRRVYKRV